MKQAVASKLVVALGLLAGCNDAGKPDSPYAEVQQRQVDAEERRTEVEARRAEIEDRPAEVEQRRAPEGTASPADPALPGEALARGEPANQRDAQVPLAQPREETQSAASQSLKEYDYARKVELVNKMKRELDDMEKELDRLSERIEHSKAEASTEAKARHDASRQRWAEAKKRLAEVEAATESSWNQVKDGFASAYGAVKESLSATRQWMREKLDS
jgi:hypothetical protein